MGKWWSKDASPEIKETELLEINGNGNTINTTHLQHLENISIAVSVVAILLVVGAVIFLICRCLSYIRERERKNLQKAIARGL